MSDEQYLGFLDEVIRKTTGRTEVPMSLIMESLKKSNLREINVSNLMHIVCSECVFYINIVIL